VRKNKRPAWCPHTDCKYHLSTQDLLCVGHLPEQIEHDGDVNIYRMCINCCGEVFDLQINDTDIYHLKRLLDSLKSSR